MEEQPTPPSVPAAPDKQSFLSRLREAQKKKYFTLTILGVLLLVLFGAAGISFALYQQPNNVLGSAFQNALNARHVAFDGTLSTVSSPNTVAIVYHGGVAGKAVQLDASFTIAGNSQKTSLGSSVVYDDKGTLYLKVSGISSLIKSSTSSADLQAVYDAIASKIDNKWFMITDNDLQQFGVTDSGHDILKCYQTFLDQITTNTDQKNKISDLYNKYQFVTIAKTLPDQVINGANSFHYQLKFDDALAKKFMNGVSSLASFKQLDTCTGGQLSAGKAEATASPDSQSVTTEVWIDKWSHAFTKVKQISTAQDGTKANLETVLDFDKPVTVTAPKDATSLKDLLLQFQPNSIR